MLSEFHHKPVHSIRQERVKYTEFKKTTHFNNAQSNRIDALLSGSTSSIDYGIGNKS